uniref:Leucine rich repeat kinase 1 n=1 Tax=Hippocampus comes TaxID=109280 RepID=A0A3Q3DTW4_HIPCM
MAPLNFAPQTPDGGEEISGARLTGPSFILEPLRKKKKDKKTSAAPAADIVASLWRAAVRSSTSEKRLGARARLSKIAGKEICGRVRLQSSNFAPAESSSSLSCTRLGENGPPGDDGAPSCPPPSPASIRRAYEAGRRETARDLIRRADKPRACFQDDLLRAACRHGDAGSVRYLLNEAEVRVATEASERNPAVVAARFGHGAVLKMLLDAIPGRRSELLDLLLSACCQRADVDCARLLVREYGADVNGDVPAGGEELADFLLENGAALSSYALLDHPDLSARLLARRLRRGPAPNSRPGSGPTAVGVHWGGLSLPWLEVSWFLGVSRLITHLDLSRNNLSSLPSVLPWGLPRLQTLDLSRNRLTQMPPAATSREVICSGLREVNVQRNQLSALPAGLLHLSELKKLCASQNRLSALFDVPAASNWMGLRRLEELDVSDNLLSALPADITRALKSLRVLDVSRNRLGGFPEPWACPLNRCGASSNQISGLPDNISAFWKDHLRDVDLSDNLLERLPSDLFRLEALLSLRLCGNAIRTLPPPSRWTCSRLRTLDLSRNLLGRSEDGPKSRKLPFLTTWSKKDPEPAPPVDLPALLRDSLEVLHLNANRLERVPPSVCALRGLRELYLANNPGIRELPSELAALSDLWQLDLENLDIGNVPQEIRREGAAAVLGFLRARLRGAEPCHRLKMLLIGPPRQGKSSLLRALQARARSARRP